MRQALVYRKGVLSGILTEDEGEYTFSYSQDYLQKEDAKAISLTLPLREEPFLSEELRKEYLELIHLRMEKLL